MNTSETGSLKLDGKRVYAAGCIAGYSVLTNVGIGLMLLGLNVRARGEKIVGYGFIAIGIAAIMGTGCVAMFTQLPFVVILFINLLGALGLYRFEKEEVKVALQQGAIFARWWLPALWVIPTIIALTLIVAVIAAFLQ